MSAGFYSLRYELIPDDGNHLGAAPNRDFLLLIPVAADTDPNAALKFQELVSLSRKATGTKHPGPLNLVQAESRTAAAVSKDDKDNWKCSFRMKPMDGKVVH